MPQNATNLVLKSGTKSVTHMTCMKLPEDTRRCKSHSPEVAQKSKTENNSDIAGKTSIAIHIV